MYLENVAEARVEKGRVGLDLDAAPAEGGAVGPDVVELWGGRPVGVQPPGSPASGLDH